MKWYSPSWKELKPEHTQKEKNGLMTNWEDKEFT